jgi:hypothetical protein
VRSPPDYTLLLLKSNTINAGGYRVCLPDSLQKMNRAVRLRRNCFMQRPSA